MCQDQQTGFVHLYTGDGKGKTTAAIGLAVRAAGAGMRVLFAQFMKGRACNEWTALAAIGDRIAVRQYGSGEFVTTPGDPEAAKLAREGLTDTVALMRSKRFHLVVLDEINVACHFKLIEVDDVLDAIASRPANVELVMTGRRADAKLIERADLVTEMKDIRHYADKGVAARPGIEQ